MKKSTLIFLFCLGSSLFAQDFKINRVEPSNWWAGMKHNKIQLMLTGTGLSGLEAVFPTGIKLLGIHQAESNSYAFIDIEIPGETRPGTYELKFIKGKKEVDLNFPVLARDDKESHSGFSNADAIYFLLPDRFADGDKGNDSIKGMADNYNRNGNISRHGGDLKGLIDHLDYIKNLGCNTVWVSPVVENNCEMSYHGYAATDFYKTDPRLGTNELYRQLSRELHSRGMKLIMDHVSNHISENHPWIKDLPMKSFINGSMDKHQSTRHQKLAMFDIHSDSSDIRCNQEGWFTGYMPDLNQRNQFLANYIIQNSIWWVEYAGVDGIREDTYSYSDQEFLSRWAREMLEEYPALNITGEIWTGEIPFLAEYQQNAPVKRPFDSNLPSVIDFGMADIFRGWLSGSMSLVKIYEGFAKDFLYYNPDNLLTFIDNHDMQRAMMLCQGNVAKYKTALTMLLTTRGIPSIFSGTEIGILGGKDDGSVRADFPGGFPGDRRNAFTKEGRTQTENEIFDYLSKLLKLRGEYRALSIGKMIQYYPQDDQYFYLKILGDQSILVVINGKDKEAGPDLLILGPRLKGYGSLKNLITGESTPISGGISLKPFSSGLFLLQH